MIQRVTSPPIALRQRSAQAGISAFGPSWLPGQWSFAPGRLELLGNHVDYNGGLVLAGAINLGVCITAGKGGRNGTIGAVAGDFAASPITLSPDEVRDGKLDGSDSGPEAYLAGVIASLQEAGHAIRTGRQLSITGDVPLGVGMSSSASLCVALVLILATDRPSDREVILIAQRAEHLAGSPVGAMDQSASVAGGIILFDGNDTTFTRVVPEIDGYVFAVADSGVSHALGTSSYPTRVNESAGAVRWLRDHGAPDLLSLGQLSDGTWAKIRSDHPEMSEIMRRRVTHVVTEIDRVRSGATAIKQRDWPAFGALMTASGRSSANDYEISHPRVEELVSEISAMEGVLGARMMGGGEGGPALALLDVNAVDETEARLRDGYFARHPESPLANRFQVCVFGPGANSGAI